jgi:hypothetical protein
MELLGNMAVGKGFPLFPTPLHQVVLILPFIHGDDSLWSAALEAALKSVKMIIQFCLNETRR